MINSNGNNVKYKIVSKWGSYTLNYSNGYIDIPLPQIEGYNCNTYRTFCTFVANSAGVLLIPYKLSIIDYVCRIALWQPDSAVNSNVYCGIMCIYDKA